MYDVSNIRKATNVYQIDVCSLQLGVLLSMQKIAIKKF